jgi:hypothetical protein
MFTVMDLSVGRPVISAAMKLALVEVGATGGFLPWVFSVDVPAEGDFWPLGFFVASGEACSAEVEAGTLVAGSLTSGVCPGWEGAGIAAGAQAARKSSKQAKEKEMSFCIRHPFTESQREYIRRMFRNCLDGVIEV